MKSPALPTGPAGAALPEGAEKRNAVRQMFDTIAERYDLLNTVLSFGLDKGWRRRCVDALGLPTGSLVLDVACGTGDLCTELGRQRMRPVGLDLSSGMLRRARARPSAGSGPLILADALASPFRESTFDGAVSGFALRNVVDLGALFEEIARVTRPGGRISLLELGEPEAPMLRPGHHLWATYAVPLIGRLLSDRDAYRYLPRSLAYLPTPATVVGLLERSGFAAVQRRLLAGGVSQLYVATRAPRRPR
jgi:demethylmenaquinone methyltransferase/2-methoxy-6-polyprenyl-1,4-benzoquinol methylase